MAQGPYPSPLRASLREPNQIHAGPAGHFGQPASMSQAGWALGNPAEDNAQAEQAGLLGGPGGARDIKQAGIDVRAGFIRKVYGILSAQLALTVVVAFFIWREGKDRDWLRSHEWVLWFSVGMIVVTICVMTCCQSVCRTYPQNYIFLFIFTGFEAILIGFLSAMYTWQSVLLCAGVVMGIFTGLTLYAISSRSDFTGMGPYLMAFLLALLILGIVMAVLPAFGLSITWLNVLYDLLGVTVFSFYIVFDTQLILGEWGGHRLGFSVDDYVFAALNLYMDIINIFLYLLSLLGDRRR
uniref:Uncharacterized protein n=1 Tax=Alexandrium andersonii TaxID=327968 RepID=A0A7S2F099_9DINO